ncbi:MAG: alpha/beta hydrolase [Verrucomicrobiae bacterium]|nr:alpha/beta hydrolase [Verrucomicrobiae bacterium]
MKIALASIFISLFVSLSVTARDPYIPSTWTKGWVMANGIRMHYWRTGGDKPQMLMAHGYSDTGLCWTSIAQELDDRYDIILPDARGFGLTDPPSKDEPVDVQVEDLAALIKELGLKKPILMGHSMGSSSVAWFSARYPAVPKAAILVDPRLVSSGSGFGPRSPEETAKAMADIIKRNNMTYEALIDGQIKNHPEWGITALHFWALSKQLYHPNTAYRSSGDRPSMSELFEKIKCPTLILKADNQGAEREENIKVASILRKGKLVHVEGAGHTVHWDQKERFLAALNPFLKQL